MQVAFFSNYLNHHQLPLCQAMCKAANVAFTFVATTPTPGFRKKLGYPELNKQYPFVLTTYDSKENREKALQLALESDVIITGSAPEIYTSERSKKNKLTFRYSERIFKKGFWRWRTIRHLGGIILKHTRYWKKPLYMLCASAYTAADFAKGGAYIGKTYKWGYFPEVKPMDTEAIFAQKQRKEKPVLLWVGRLIDWKHPEAAIELAERLKKDGYDFELRLVGNGKLHDKLAAMIETKGLSDCVKLLGAMPPEAVREQMEEADIFLFTSDFHEGWGAVLNEAMNSGCAVVASHAIGSVPFLMKHGENGFVYKNGNDDDFYEKTKQLLLSPELREKFGRAAYETLATEWNADTAAERFLVLCDCLQKGKETPYATGPCSRA